MLEILRTPQQFCLEERLVIKVAGNTRRSVKLVRAIGRHGTLKHRFNNLVS